jgi:hypothetical protein
LGGWAVNGRELRIKMDKTIKNGKIKPTCGLFSKHRDVAAVELIDGAYEIVELWRAEFPSQKKWQKAWLKKARELGAGTFMI